MSRSQQPTLKWKPPLKILVVDYIRKHKRVKRADLYSGLSADDRAIRYVANVLIKEGRLDEEPCECGNTSFLKLA